MLLFQNNVRLPEGMSVYNAYENNLYWYILKTKEKTWCSSISEVEWISGFMGHKCMISRICPKWSAQNPTMTTLRPLGPMGPEELSADHRRYSDLSTPERRNKIIEKTEETWWETRDRHGYFWVYPSVIKWKLWCEYNPWVMFHVWPEGTSNKDLNFMDD